MRITVERSALVKAMRIVAPAASNKSPRAIQQSILLDASVGSSLLLVASDLDEREVQASVPMEVEERGSMALPGKLFAEVVKSLDGDEVNFETIEQAGEEGTPAGVVGIVTSGEAKFRLPALPRDDFESLGVPEIDSARAALTVPAHVLGAVLQRTLFAVEKEGLRHILAGVLFAVAGETMTVAATDTYRLALAEDIAVHNVGGGGREARAIVPAAVLKELAKIIKQSRDEYVTMILTPSRCGFTVGTTGYVARVIEGQYVPYERIIPQEFTKQLTVAREPLLQALRGVRIMDKDVKKAVLEMEAGTLTVWGEADAATGSGGKDRTETMLPVTYEGDEPNFTMALDAKYLTEVLAAVYRATVVYALNGDNEAIQLTAPGDLLPGYLHILMPMAVFGA